VHLEDAKAALTRLYTALRSVSGSATVDWDEAHAQRFKKAMDDDFNTAEAVAELQKLANLANTGDARAGLQLKALGGVLGILQRDPVLFLQGVRENTASHSDFAKRIDKLIQERNDARKRKDFAAADRIRKELEAAGVVLDDSPAGTTWRRA
jgi:cysteinyl-tRNA synthetase